MKDSLRYQGKNSAIHPKRMLVWILIASMVMFFAAFASAVIVKKSDGNWLIIEIPQIFVLSTAIIVLSSVIVEIGKYLYRKGVNLPLSRYLVVLTLLLAVAFFFTQRKGWLDLYESGISFGGPASHSAGSFIYVIVWAHLAHIILGFMYLGALLFSLIARKSNEKELIDLGSGVMINTETKRRFESATLFWHFLGLLWIFLYVFLLVNYN